MNSYNQKVVKDHQVYYVRILTDSQMTVRTIVGVIILCLIIIIMFGQILEWVLDITEGVYTNTPSAIMGLFWCFLAFRLIDSDTA